MEVDIKKVKLVIWDWYRTLSNRHLYENLQQSNPGAYDLIQKYFLDDKSRLDAWLRGEISYDEIHRNFSRLTGLSKATFDNCLSILATKFDVDEKIAPFIRKFGLLGTRQIICTDNYDIWDEFLLPQYSKFLSNYLSTAYNSGRFRILTSEGQLDFLLTVVSQEHVAVEHVLLIDDNSSLSREFVSRGAQSINHSSVNDLAVKLSVVFSKE